MLALALALPALYAAGIVARRPVPRTGEVPAAIVSPLVEGSSYHVAFTVDVGLGAAVRLTPIDAEAGQRTVSLELIGDARRPELLVYWVGHAGAGPGVPPDARFVGSFAGGGPQRFELPADAAPGAGQVLLYTLAHDEVVATIALSGNGT